MWRSSLVVAVTVMGCATEPASRLDVSVAPVTTQCATVRGSQLGALPLNVSVGNATVRFREWTLADEHASSFYGFAAELPANVVFTVSAGERTFTGRGGRWVHPNGFDGPRAHAIDAVTFCRLGPAEDVVAVR